VRRSCAKALSHEMTSVSIHQFLRNNLCKTSACRQRKGPAAAGPSFAASLALLRRYFSDVNERSQAAFSWFTTPFTFFDLSIGPLSQSHSTPGAAAVTMSSIWPQALARC
jgi:hypothetical protein